MNAIASQPLPSEIVQAASASRIETRKLARQVRRTGQALAQLDEACKKYGIHLEVTSDTGVDNDTRI